MIASVWNHGSQLLNTVIRNSLCKLITKQIMLNTGHVCTQYYSVVLIAVVLCSMVSMLMVPSRCFFPTLCVWWHPAGGLELASVEHLHPSKEKHDTSILFHFHFSAPVAGPGSLCVWNISLEIMMWSASLSLQGGVGECWTAHPPMCSWDFC